MMLRNIRSAFLLAGIGVAVVLAWYAGLINAAWEQESVWTRGLILAILGWAAVCFVGSFRSRRWLHYGVDVCPVLGMLGAVVGVSVELDTVANSADIMHLVGGLSVVVHATIAGMLGALIVYMQKIAIERDVSA